MSAYTVVKVSVVDQICLQEALKHLGYTYTENTAAADLVDERLASTSTPRLTIKSGCGTTFSAFRHVKGHWLFGGMGGLAGPTKRIIDKARMIYSEKKIRRLSQLLGMSVSSQETVSDGRIKVRMFAP